MYSLIWANTLSINPSPECLLPLGTDHTHLQRTKIHPHPGSGRRPPPQRVPKMPQGNMSPYPRWLSLEVWCLFLGLCFRIWVWNNHMSLLLFHVLRDMTTIIHISSTNIPVFTKDVRMLTICLQTFEVLTLAHSCVLCPPHKHRLALWTHVHTDSGCSPAKSHTVRWAMFPTHWMTLPLQGEGCHYQVRIRSWGCMSFR